MCDMDIKPGTILKTSYGTGPYIVELVHGPCTCNHPVAEINGIHRVSEEHYHFTLRHIKNIKGDRFWLNAYKKEADRYLSVWNPVDEIFVIGKGDPTEMPGYKEESKQLELF